MYRRPLYLTIAALFLILMTQAGIFAADINIVSNSLEFSQGKILYSLDAKGKEALIKSVVLEYWLGNFPDSGSKIEKVFIYKNPAEDVQARFTAPLVQSTYFSVPQIYFYNWIIEDTYGKKIETGLQYKIYNMHPEKFDWTIIESDNFVLYHYEENPEKVKSVIKYAEIVYYELKSDFSHNMDDKINIFMFKNEQDAAIMGLEPDIWQNMENIFGINSIILLSEAGIAQDILKRKLTHLILHRISEGKILDNAWLEEGIVLFQCEQADVLSRYENDYVKLFLKDKLFRLEYLADSSMKKDALKNKYILRQGYGFVTYIIETYGWQTIRQVVRQLKTKNIDETLTNVYGMNLDTLQRRWKTSLKKKYSKSNTIKLKDMNLSKEERTIRRILKTYEIAFNAGNIDEISAYFHDDFKRIYSYDSTSINDRRQYIDKLGNFFLATAMRTLEISSGSLKYTFDTAEIKAVLYSKGSYRTNWKLSYSSVDFYRFKLAKENGQWKIIQIEGSSDKPVFTRKLLLSEKEIAPGSTTRVFIYVSDAFDNMSNKNGIVILDKLQDIAYHGVYTNHTEKETLYIADIVIPPTVNPGEYSLEVTIKDEFDNYDQKSITYIVK